MNASKSNSSVSLRRAALSAALLGLVACAAAPHGPSTDVVRLQQEQGRLHSDPRIAANGGAELANADAAVATLAQNARTLDAREYRQGVYLSGKLLQIAEASALARDAERRGERLGLERERLGAGGTRHAVAMTNGEPLRRDDRAPLQDDREHLFAMQRQLANSESRVDERGLVLRLAEYNFRSGGDDGLTATGESALTSLARVLGDEPHASARIVAFGDRGVPGDRALAVRDYLDAHGIDPSRLDLRSARDDAPVGVARGDVLIIVRE